MSVRKGLCPQSFQHRSHLSPLQAAGEGPWTAGAWPWDCHHPLACWSGLVFFTVSNAAFCPAAAHGASVPGRLCPPFPSRVNLTPAPSDGGLCPDSTSKGHLGPKDSVGPPEEPAPSETGRPVLGLPQLIPGGMGSLNQERELCGGCPPALGSGPCPCPNVRPTGADSSFRQGAPHPCPASPGGAEATRAALTACRPASPA